MPRNGTQKGADRAQKICLTAARLFFENGLESTSVSEIAGEMQPGIIVENASRLSEIRLASCSSRSSFTI